MFYQLIILFDGLVTTYDIRGKHEAVEKYRKVKKSGKFNLLELRNEIGILIFKDEK